MSPIGEAALALAERGLPVLPADPITKFPPMAGWPDLATTDPATIESWFVRWPSANVAVKLGPAAGIIDVECDGPEQEKALGQLFGEDAPAAPTFTSSRGRHRLFKWTDDLPAKAVTKIDGIEFRIGGGDQAAISIFPPSVHASGKPYTWLVPFDEGELVPLPAHVREQLKSVVKHRPADEPGAIRDGCRNAQLTSMAGSMRHRGMGETAILSALMAENSERCVPPLPDAEVAAIAKSVARYAPDPLASVVVKIGKPTAPAAELVPAGFGAPIPFSQLKAVSEEALWLWRGGLARGHVTLMSALWKAGKSTLLTHLLRQLGTGGGFLGQPVSPGKALVISEESQSIWAARRDALRLGDWCRLWPQPFVGKPRKEDWLAFLSAVCKALDDDPAELIVFDTLSSLWPVREENSAGEVAEALAPLRQLKDRNAAVLLIHHVGKNDVGEARASRGSGALPAYADAILELRRFDAANRQDRRRTINGFGRWDCVPGELVIELAPDGSGYSACGDRAAVHQSDIRALILASLPAVPPGMTGEQVRANWPEADKPGEKKLAAELASGAAAGIWSRHGTGLRGQPFTYHQLLRNAPPL
jgi:hypothetical protein